MNFRKKKKVLIFSPFAYIWVHALPEIQLGKILERNGISVSLLGCSENFQEYCTSMTAAGLELTDQDFRKQQICDYCVKLRSYSEELPQIKFLSTAMNYYEMKFIQIPNSLENQVALTVGGVGIGKIALYETLIKYKKVNLKLTDVERLHYEASLRNAIRSYDIATKVLKDEAPDTVICYSPQYIVPGIFAAVAKSMGIPVIFVEGSNVDTERYSHLRLWDWEEFGLSQPALSNPTNFELYTPTRKAIQRAEKQIKTKYSSATFSVYSPASKGQNPIDFFGLDASKKTYLMAMSSYDEVYSGFMIGKLPIERFRGLVFEDQVEWLEKTIHWFSNNPDLQLIVRPHPREFPNKRESETSDHYQAWERVLRDLPTNVRLDHPSLGFSLFDHFKKIDVVITGWSSTGLEALANGIPVVTYDQNLPTFSSSIHLTGNSQEEYFENLLKAATEGSSDLNRINAIRWLAFTADVGTVQVGGRLSDRIGFLRQSKISRVINSRYLSFIVKRIELRIPPSRLDDRRIIDVVNGKAKSLFNL